MRNNKLLVLSSVFLLSAQAEDHSFNKQLFDITKGGVDVGGFILENKDVIDSEATIAQLKFLSKSSEKLDEFYSAIDKLRDSGLSKAHVENLSDMVGKKIKSYQNVADEAAKGAKAFEYAGYTLTAIDIGAKGASDYAFYSKSGDNALYKTSMLGSARILSEVINRANPAQVLGVVQAITGPENCSDGGAFASWCRISQTIISEGAGFVSNIPGYATDTVANFDRQLVKLGRAREQITDGESEQNSNMENLYKNPILLSNKEILMVALGVDTVEELNVGTEKVMQSIVNRLDAQILLFKSEIDSQNWIISNHKGAEERLEHLERAFPSAGVFKPLRYLAHYPMEFERDEVRVLNHARADKDAWELRIRRAEQLKTDLQNKGEVYQSIREQLATTWLVKKAYDLDNKLAKIEQDYQTEVQKILVEEKNKIFQETEEKLKTVTQSNVYNPEILLNNQLNQLAAQTQGLTSHFGSADFFMQTSQNTANSNMFNQSQYDNQQANRLTQTTVEDNYGGYASTGGSNTYKHDSQQANQPTQTIVENHHGGAIQRITTVFVVPDSRSAEVVEPPPSPIQQANDLTQTTVENHHGGAIQDKTTPGMDNINVKANINNLNNF